MNSVHRPDPPKQATLTDGFLCPINSGPLACFLCVSWVQGWSCYGTVQRNYSALLTRLFGKIRVTNSPSSLWGEKYVPFEVATEITTLPLQRCAPVPSFSPGTTIFRSQQKLLAMQAMLSLFCLQAKRPFSFCKYWKGKEMTVAPYYPYVLLWFQSVCSTQPGLKTALFLLSGTGW